MSSNIVRDESVSQPVGALAAWRYPAFRLYFTGQLVSVTGTWMQAVAQQIVVFNLTHSEFALGLVAAAQGLPALILSPFAGVIVDRYPKRRLLIITQSLMMVLAFVMAWLYFVNQLQVWHIVALSLGLGVANALDAPARQAFVVEMVGHPALSSGVVMNSMMFNSARVIGPAVGGIALYTLGAGWCFFLNGASFLAVIVSLLLMRVVERPFLTGRIAIIGPLKEGFAFARSHPTIRPLLLLAASASLFTSTFATLIPAFASQILHDTTEGTSALYTAQGLGAALAALLVARMTNTGRRGTLLGYVALSAPLFVIAFSLTRSYVTALPVVGFAGLTGIAQFILMNTLIQNEVPDEYRGRVMALYTLTFFGLSPFSNLAIGVLAQWTSTPFAIGLYGVVALVCAAAIFWRAPQLWRLR
ncbi:MAG TPA: MFS transporter [Aggregatilineaceae bacterium]|nr:MFS transporter [Aggregatilineaceae bacterium]